MVPMEVISADMDGDFCYVVENDMVVKKRLKTGIASDTDIEVLEGLKEGDQVILDTAMIEEGMAVTAIPEDNGMEQDATETTETAE